MTGLAQKGGAVFSHVRIADRPEQLHAVRIATGEADALIGGDLIVSAGSEALLKLASGRSHMVVNCAATPTADFTHDPDWQFPLAKMQDCLRAAVGADSAVFLDASALARRLLGDAIFANTLLLGYTWQRGLVPVSRAALEYAIELNGTAVAMNLKAFLWGRRAARDLVAIERYAGLMECAESPTERTLEQLIAARVNELTAYQDAAYAERYRQLVERVRIAAPDLAETVAHNYFKLLAIKDEYEVARLHADPAFLAAIDAAFEGDYRINFHIAPPLLASIDPRTGRPHKRAVGPWLLGGFRWLAKARKLRDTRWDIFRHSEERRSEKQLIADYEADVELVVARQSPENLASAQTLLEWPAQVRGYGVVKMKNMQTALAKRALLRAKL
jgi:indolepyruvate ferredoxin oxidoreductase